MFVFLYTCIRVRSLNHILILQCGYLLIPKAPTEQSDEKSKELITTCEVWIRKSSMEKLWKIKQIEINIMNPFKFITLHIVDINIKTNLITNYTEKYTYFKSESFLVLFAQFKPQFLLE